MAPLMGAGAGVQAIGAGRSGAGSRLPDVALPCLAQLTELALRQLPATPVVRGALGENRVPTLLAERLGVRLADGAAPATD